jgi:delta 1-pyrroline-5-carboxylate dehydrogenase
MTTESAPRIKVTYATLRPTTRSSTRSSKRRWRRRARRSVARIGTTWTARWRDGAGSFEVRSPIDSEIVLGTFAKGTEVDIDDAVAAARRAQPSWAARPGASAWPSSSAQGT